MRLVISEPASGCIVQFSKREREVYYAFIAFQNGIDPDEPEMLKVVNELDNCIMNELQCKTPTYIDRCFNLKHEWEDCIPEEVPEIPSTVELLRSEYDQKVVDEDLTSNTLYLVKDDATPDQVSWIYNGLVLLWTNHIIKGINDVKRFYRLG
jgi:hypothetical protein